MVQMVVGVGTNRGVGSDDALRFSRRPRGEHHIGGLLRADIDGPEIVGTVDVRMKSSSMTIAAPLWRRIEFTRSAGIPGSKGHVHRAGFQRREDRHNIAGPRDSLMATGVSATAPRAASAPASRLAAVSSSP